MFYRQKILTSLIEVFGGQLPNTDLEKLLFLFCQLNHQNYYDFFPYKFGAFSFITYYDKQKLVKQGVFKDSNSFELTGSKSFINQIESSDRIKLRAFATKYRSLRGQDLIRKTYLEYPRYAAKSEIASTLLSAAELHTVSSSWNNDSTLSLFTIGYESSTIDEYLYRLVTNNVKMLVDVRKNPFSHKHGFTQRDLKNYAEKAGVTYEHLPNLGIASHLRKDLDAPGDYHTLFEHYAKTILPAQDESIAKLKHWLHVNRRVAITCFEANPLMCHRHKIAELIEVDTEINIPVSHL